MDNFSVLTRLTRDIAHCEYVALDYARRTLRSPRPKVTSALTRATFSSVHTYIYIYIYIHIHIFIFIYLFVALCPGELILREELPKGGVEVRRHLQPAALDAQT